MPGREANTQGRGRLACRRANIKTQSGAKGEKYLTKGLVEGRQREKGESEEVTETE